MSGGGSGGSTVVEPSTTTTVQDIPAWEQGYVTDLLGQAQTEAQQPYQQFPGQQVAGFTNDQNQAFSNIEGAGATNAANQNAAMGQAQQGANTANSIYGAGAGDVNAASSYNPLAAVSPYLGAASGYNAAAAAQPYLNQSQGYNAAAAGVATPQGIQSYLSPYTQNVVGGLENTANQNWNQNIMPGVNNEFVGSGQFGSGRNAQVLGQAANEEQTNLNTSVANALQSGYTTAGNQAATEAGILGNAANTAISGANTAGAAQTAQIGNLLNQGNAASTAANQQASNLVNQGTALGNLASTQAGQQLNAGTALSNIGTQAANTNLTQNQALQATGQEQQQLDQANLNTAMQNWTNQTQYPEQQSQFLNQIIRGLPSPTATTSAGQTPAYSVSPLSGIGGAGIGTLALSGSNGQQLGTAQAAKTGGLIKSYAEGGKVKGYSGADGNSLVDDSYGADDEDMTPLDYATMPDNSPDTTGTDTVTTANPLDQTPADDSYGMDNAVQSTAPVADNQTYAPSKDSIPYNDAPDTKSDAVNPLTMDDSKSSGNAISNNVTPAQTQQLQLLALARGMLTPQMNGSSLAAFGQGLGNVADVTQKQNELQMKQNAFNYQQSQDKQRMAIDQQKADALSANSQEQRIKQLMTTNPGMTYDQASLKVTGKASGTQRGTSGSANTAQQPEFGGSISALAANAEKRKAAVKDADTIVNNNNNNDRYLTEAQRAMGDINKNISDLKGATYVDPGSGLGQAQVQVGKLYGSDAAKAAQGLDASTNDLATNLNALQYKPGTRGGALQLKTVLASKPLGSNFSETNEQRANEINAQIAETQLENKLVNSFVEKNPLGTIAADNFNAYDLRDALSKKYPLYAGGKFQSDNAQKWEDSIPDAIQNPYNYLGKGSGGVSSSSSASQNTPSSKQPNAAAIAEAKRRGLIQ